MIALASSRILELGTRLWKGCHSDRTTVMAGIRQHPLGAGKSSARCAVPSTRTLTERFSLKYSSSPLHRSFFERCIMNQNSARILASRKECYAQKNRSPE
jgi:hypothetical protein